MDKILNGINRICDTYVSVKLSSAASRLAENMPAKLIIAIITPLKSASGSEKGRIKDMQKDIYRALETCSTPIGMSVAAVSIFIILLFFLS